jgi:hypothetical protein
MAHHHYYFLKVRLPYTVSCSINSSRFDSTYSTYVVLSHSYALGVSTIHCVLVVLFIKINMKIYILLFWLDGC